MSDWSVMNMNTVRIEQGVVAGSHEDGVFRFLGMPYAAPPVGNLRWRPPAPPSSWDGVRDATVFGNAAIQTIYTGFDAGAPQSEDCLNLNVWTTTLDPDARQPVMLWIHGGGFLNGAASMPIWQGNRLARRGVTVVSCNYRLGAFGFLAHTQAGGNFAILDWVAALTWISANIRALGGDPDNVTVFGQSAGAAAVRALLSTPLAHGLFRRGIMQSAGYERYAAVPSPSYERALAATEKLCSLLGSHEIEALRQMPAEKVRAAARSTAGTIPPAGEVHTPANLVWYPTVDGSVMTEDFSGWPADVPVMFGCTEDEARMFVTPTGVYGRPDLDPNQVYTLDTLAHMARALGGAKSDSILAYFARTGQAPYEALAELFTAALWIEPALASFQRFSQLDRATYYYRFARVSPGALRSGNLACHSSEIPYIFGTLKLGEDYDETDVKVAETLQHAWTEFARTGVPYSLDGTPWPRCTVSGSKMTLIGDSAASQPLNAGTVVTLINSLRSS